jgi:hypothetical protein
MQYLDQGEGLPFFLSHGVLGGYDNVRELIDLYVGKDGRAIGPSRFGYLGSSMPNDATPADQADARIHGARLVTLQHGGHLFLQHADAVRAAVGAFLADVMPTGATA